MVNYFLIGDTDSNDHDVKTITQTVLPTQHTGIYDISFN